MSITRIYNTELNQGANELSTFRRALTGKWGTDNSGNVYTGNIIHGLVTSGETISNIGMTSRAMAIVLFVDGSYTITSLEPNESRVLQKQIKMAINIVL